VKRIPRSHPRSRRAYQGARFQGGSGDTYAEFSAAELYCSSCQMAVPVKERLLLILPDGELYEYICSRCGTSVGEKTSRQKQDLHIVLA
jgi:hypothetical protein